MGYIKLNFSICSYEKIKGFAVLCTSKKWDWADRLTGTHDTWNHADWTKNLMSKFPGGVWQEASKHGYLFTIKQKTALQPHLKHKMEEK